MFLKSKMLSRALAAFFLITLVSSFALAFLHTRAMAASDMPMVGCPFMTEDAPVLCTMSPMEHISAWQHMFLAIPTTGMILLLSLTLLAIAIPFLYSKREVKYHFYFSNTPLTVKTAQLSFQSYIQQAFSQGILNPKLF